MTQPHLEQLSKRVRAHIITATTAAGSGHPSSSLSATDLMTVLLFGGFFQADPDNPHNSTNDRLIFSKGHAAPLLYALYAAAGKVSQDELKTLRQFGSRLEGHPTMAFPYTEAATGSLGQGLSIGLGMALAAEKIDQLPYRTFVLLGDSEMAEGSVWEAIELAGYYKTKSLVGIIDVNRLGQRGQTMLGHDSKQYARRIEAFGWQAITIDGHSLIEITEAYKKALAKPDRPTMIIAKTVKGRGVSLLEDQDGWHGKPLNQEQAEAALRQLGPIDPDLAGTVSPPPRPPKASAQKKPTAAPLPHYDKTTTVAPRKAYGLALNRIADQYPDIVVLDAEVSNSTYSELFKKEHLDRFIETFIAEQNMIGIATGLSRRGKIPFASTFAAFLTRAFDHIRMSHYSEANIKIVGSHAGVSIGEDGASQMGLEDMAMFRSVLGSTVLYPADAVATDHLVEAAAEHRGLVYIRTTRQELPILYDNNESFTIGGSKVLRKSSDDRATIVAAGITVHEALAAADRLAKEKIKVRVIDLYSIKPIDRTTLREAAKQTSCILTVEDHVPEGGLGEAVMAALADHPTPIYSLAVRKTPMSGKPNELLDYERISAQAIYQRIKEAL